MTDNTNNTDTIASRGKRYTVGDTFKTVATMGLKATDSTRKATVAYQFSRKTGKDGTMDLPAGTDVRYVGAKPVYEGQASTKRMMFRVAQGSTVILNGASVILDRDIDIAGVVNHIDPEDPYNVEAAKNDLKKAEKAALKAQAVAVKASAA